MTAPRNQALTKNIAFCDLEREIGVTRRVLESLPEAHFAWKPHEKSMNFGRLAMHVATLLQWFLDTLRLDELDLASPPQIPTEATSKAHLLQTFEQNAAAVVEAMAKTDDAVFERIWKLRNGDQVLFSQPRITVLRTWCLNHLIHHRGQLCLYLRLLNIPVPTIYFNTADDPTWVFA